MGIETRVAFVALAAAALFACSDPAAPAKSTILGQPDAEAPDASVPVDADVGVDAADASKPDSAAADAGLPTPNVGWLWHPSRVDSVRGVATDAAGATFAVGEFTGALVDFGAGHIASSADEFSSDAFVVKLDASGAPAWAVAIGGANADEGAAIAVDLAGDVYVTGRYESSQGYAFNLGGLTISAPVGAQYGGFAAKLKGSDGSVLWAIPLASAGSGVRFACRAAAATTKVVAFGCDFDGKAFEYPGGSLQNLDQVALRADVAVLAVDPATGKALWANRIGTAGALDAIGNLAADSSGDVLVSATVYGATVADALGSLSASKIGLFSNGVLGRMSAASGKLAWSRLVGGGAPIDARAIGADGVGHLFATGSVTTAGDLGLSAPITTAGPTDAYVAALDASTRATSWAKLAGGSDHAPLPFEFAAAIAVDGQGNALVGGAHFSTDAAAFGSAIQNPLAAGHLGAAFCAKLTPAGAVTWSYGFPASGVMESSQVTSVAFAAGGAARVGGLWQGAARIDGAMAYKSNLGGSTPAGYVLAIKL